jgi:hypothetical protein
VESACLHKMQEIAGSSPNVGKDSSLQILIYWDKFELAGKKRNLRETRYNLGLESSEWESST